MAVKITKDMVWNFKNMLGSDNEKDLNIVYELFENRDVDDPETVENYNDILKELTEQVLPKNIIDKREVWVIKSKGEIVAMDNGKHSWKAKNHASSALSNHLATYTWRRNSKFLKIFKNILELKTFLLDNKILEIVQIK